MPNTEDYPIRWSAIHFGLSADIISAQNFLDFQNIISAYGWLIFIDGDGWFDWRQLPGTGNNDTTSMHIYIAVPTKKDAASVITALRDAVLSYVPLLVADEHGNSTAVTVVATQAENWSERFYTEAFGAIA